MVRKKAKQPGIPLSFFSRFVFVTYETSVARMASLFSDWEENIYISEKNVWPLPTNLACCLDVRKGQKGPRRLPVYAYDTWYELGKHEMGLPLVQWGVGLMAELLVFSRLNAVLMDEKVCNSFFSPGASNIGILLHRNGTLLCCLSIHETPGLFLAGSMVRFDTKANF